jgi:hypothetical protein
MEGHIISRQSSGMFRVRFLDFKMVHSAMGPKSQKKTLMKVQKFLQPSTEQFTNVKSSRMDKHHITSTFLAVI